MCSAGIFVEAKAKASWLLKKPIDLAAFQNLYAKFQNTVVLNTYSSYLKCICCQRTHTTSERYNDALTIYMRLCWCSLLRLVLQYENFQAILSFRVDGLLIERRGRLRSKALDYESVKEVLDSLNMKTASRADIEVFHKKFDPKCIFVCLCQVALALKSQIMNM